MTRGDRRLFVALPVPGDAARAIDVLLAPWRTRHSEARWIPLPHLHQTLVFLGGVPEEEVAQVASLIDPIAAGQPPFEVAIGHGSGRPRRGDDGVAWLTLERGGSETADLAGRLQGPLARWAHPTREGPPGGRPAGERPHVTIARRASGALIAELAEIRPEPPIAWRADRVVLFRSHLGPPGARYEALHESLLEGG